MVWLRIDDAEFEHRRWQRLELEHGPRAWADCTALWARLGTICACRLGEPDGIVPDGHIARTDLRSVPPLETGIERCIEIMIDTGLLRRTDLPQAPFAFADYWLEQQPSSEQVLRKREAAAERKRRYGVRNGVPNAVPARVENGVPVGVPNAPPDPDPDPDPRSLAPSEQGACAPAGRRSAQRGQKIVSADEAARRELARLARATTIEAYRRCSEPFPGGSLAWNASEWRDLVEWAQSAMDVANGLGRRYALEAILVATIGASVDAHRRKPIRFWFARLNETWAEIRNRVPYERTRSAAPHVLEVAR